jgi:hypothetical protein
MTLKTLESQKKHLNMQEKRERGRKSLVKKKKKSLTKLVPQSGE